MYLHLSHNCSAAPVHPTPNALAVAALFGIGLNQRDTLPLLEPVQIPVEPGSIILITGPSGSGKSTLLRLIAGELARRRMPHADLAGVAVSPEHSLVDGFPGLPLDTILGHLSRAGLSDAFVLLRSPTELSDGQKFRYRLAQWYAGNIPILLADEFAATLDRITARILAHRLRRMIQTGPARTAILATTHEDLIEDLRPDVLVYKDLGPRCDVVRRTEC